MTEIKDYAKTIEGIRKADHRYAREAYDFVMEALEHTQVKLEKRRHVSGQELLEGIREYGIQQFGALTRTVFEHWGVRRTGDFGEIVFNLVNTGLLGSLIMRRTSRPAIVPASLVACRWLSLK